MADVTREEFDALVKRVTWLELKLQPVPPVERAVTVSAAPMAGSVQVSWTATDADQVTSWLVGRDGTDTSGAGPWSTTHPPGDRSRLFNKLRPGVTYTFSVAATYADGQIVRGTAMATPLGDAVRPDVVSDPVPVGERRVPYVAKRSGGSGLPFNRLVFQGGKPDLKAMAAFGEQVKGRVDGAMTFTGRQSWAALRSGYGDTKAILDAGGIVVLSIPHAPVSEGDAMNQRGANDAYAKQQRELGAFWASNDLNVERFAIRVDWEFNGNWYPWSANRPGGPEALKASLRNFVTNVRAGGATKVRFDLCANKGPSQAGAHFPQVFPGPEYIDVLGCDQYDHWAPTYRDADWPRELAKTPTVQTVADLAKQHGIQWSWDEGGNSWDKKSGGKDNPYYWTKRWEFLTEHADTCAWDVTYVHPGAPPELRHDWASNPRSLAEYIRLYQPLG